MTYEKVLPKFAMVLLTSIMASNTHGNQSANVCLSGCELYANNCAYSVRTELTFAAPLLGIR